jgi:hypothetical protein
MTGREAETAFFIGWAQRLDRGLARFMAIAGGVVLALFLLLGAALGGASDDAADAAFAQVPGQAPPVFPEAATTTGVLLARPWPSLWLPPDAANPRGATILLSGEGKIGAPAGMESLDGRLVRADGFLVARGSLAMLATGHAPVPLEDAAPPVLPRTEPLGRWRLVGEICDGKCAAGLMRPGTGLSHRACATLCIAGAVPPVFVTTRPVAGHAYLLLADAEGGPIPPALRDWIGLRLVLEGEVQRRGDLLIFPADAASARLP